jgi:hypothetical protein
MPSTITRPDQPPKAVVAGHCDTWCRIRQRLPGDDLAQPFVVGVVVRQMMYRLFLVAGVDRCRRARSSAAP